MLKSWKTSLTGVAALISVSYKIYSHGFDFMTDAPLIMTGLGLLAAKDSNVTGGSVGATSEGKLRAGK